MHLISSHFSQKPTHASSTDQSMSCLIRSIAAVLCCTCSHGRVSSWRVPQCVRVAFIFIALPVCVWWRVQSVCACTLSDLMLRFTSLPPPPSPPPRACPTAHLTQILGFFFFFFFNETATCKKNQTLLVSKSPCISDGHER